MSRQWSAMGDDVDENEQATDHRSERPLEEDIEIICPHCGEAVVVVIDPSGGVNQDYVQDCEVCCRPWHVQVHYAGGAPEITVEAA